MGFWSDLGNAVVDLARSVARQIVKVIATIIHLAVNIFDLLVGFLKWPQKHMRIHICILIDPDTRKPIVSPSDLFDSIEFAKTAFKESFNVKLHKYSVDWVEVLTDMPPHEALNPLGSAIDLWGQELGKAGRYYAKYTAGWNAIPITFTYPITVFIVKDVKGKGGYSLGLLADWIVLDPDGVNSKSLLAHEIGHACNLVWHSDTKSNLMYKSNSRGSKAKWYQCNVLRSSRHVNYY